MYDFLNFRFFSFSAYWTPIGPLLDPYCNVEIVSPFTVDKSILTKSITPTPQSGANSKIGHNRGNHCDSNRHAPSLSKRGSIGAL